MDLLESRSSLPSSSSSSSSCGITRTKTMTTKKSKRNVGRKKFKETHHPIYKGVRRKNSSSSKWVSEVREPKRKSRIWLGTFSTPEMAARAYDVAVLALRGETTELNFPDFVWSSNRAQSSAPRDIQIATLEAATVSQASPNNFYSSPSLVLTDVESLQQQSNQYTSLTTESASGETPTFVDEEAMFNMPELINSMAEGLLLTPPAMKRGFNWDEMESCDFDLTLWRD